MLIVAAKDQDTWACNGLPKSFACHTDAALTVTSALCIIAYGIEEMAGAPDAAMTVMLKF